MNCKEAVEPVVDPIDYDMLAFLPDGFPVPSVPPNSDETLRGPIVLDDFDFFVGQLPNKKACPTSCGRAPLRL